MEIKPIKIFAAFFAIYFIWGTTFLGIRFAVETIPPFLMIGTRFVLAGILLYSLSRIRNYEKPTLSEWKKAIVVGTMMIFIGYAGLAWSEQYINSGLAALIIATIPIWMIIIDWFIFKGKKPGKMTLGGITLGLLGVSIITNVDKNSFISTSIAPALGMISCIVLLICSFTWALASLYIKRIKIGTSLLTFTGMQMIVGGIELLLLSVISGELKFLSFEMITFKSYISLFYLITFGTLIAHSAYYWLLRMSTTTKVSTYAFFNPLIAVLLGWILADEVIDMKFIFGMSAILIAIILIINPLSKIKLSEKIMSMITRFKVKTTIL